MYPLDRTHVCLHDGTDVPFVQGAHQVHRWTQLRPAFGRKLMRGLPVEPGANNNLRLEAQLFLIVQAF